MSPLPMFFWLCTLTALLCCWPVEGGRSPKEAFTKVLNVVKMGRNNGGGRLAFVDKLLHEDSYYLPAVFGGTFERDPETRNLVCPLRRTVDTILAYVRERLLQKYHKFQYKQLNELPVPKGGCHLSFPLPKTVRHNAFLFEQGLKMSADEVEALVPEGEQEELRRPVQALTTAAKAMWHGTRVGSTKAVEGVKKFYAALRNQEYNEKFTIKFESGESEAPVEMPPSFEGVIELKGINFLFLEKKLKTTSHSIRAFMTALLEQLKLLKYENLRMPKKGCYIDGVRNEEKGTEQGQQQQLYTIHVRPAQFAQTNEREFETLADQVYKRFEGMDQEALKAYNAEKQNPASALDDHIAKCDAFAQHMQSALDEVVAEQPQLPTLFGAAIVHKEGKHSHFAVSETVMLSPSHGSTVSSAYETLATKFHASAKQVLAAVEGRLDPNTLKLAPNGCYVKGKKVLKEDGNGHRYVVLGRPAAFGKLSAAQYDQVLGLLRSPVDPQVSTFAEHTRKMYADENQVKMVSAIEGCNALKALVHSAIGMKIDPEAHKAAEEGADDGDDEGAVQLSNFVAFQAIKVGSDAFGPEAKLDWSAIPKYEQERQEKLFRKLEKMYKRFFKVAEEKDHVSDESLTVAVQPPKELLDQEERVFEFLQKIRYDIALKPGAFAALSDEQYDVVVDLIRRPVEQHELREAVAHAPEVGDAYASVKHGEVRSKHFHRMWDTEWNQQIAADAIVGCDALKKVLEASLGDVDPPVEREDWDSIELQAPIQKLAELPHSFEGVLKLKGVNFAFWKKSLKSKDSAHMQAFVDALHKKLEYNGAPEMSVVPKCGCMVRAAKDAQKSTPERFVYSLDVRPAKEAFTKLSPDHYAILRTVFARFNGIGKKGFKAYMEANEHEVETQIAQCNAFRPLISMALHDTDRSDRVAMELRGRLGAQIMNSVINTRKFNKSMMKGVILSLIGSGGIAMLLDGVAFKAIIHVVSLHFGENHPFTWFVSIVLGSVTPLFAETFDSLVIKRLLIADQGGKFFPTSADGKIDWKTIWEDLKGAAQSGGIASVGSIFNNWAMLAESWSMFPLLGVTNQIAAMTSAAMVPIEVNHMRELTTVAVLEKMRTGFFPKLDAEQVLLESSAEEKNKNWFTNLIKMFDNKDEEKRKRAKLHKEVKAEVFRVMEKSATWGMALNSMGIGALLSFFIGLLPGFSLARTLSKDSWFNKLEMEQIMTIMINSPTEVLSMNVNTLTSSMLGSEKFQSWMSTSDQKNARMVGLIFEKAIQQMRGVGSTQHAVAITDAEINRIYMTKIGLVTKGSGKFFTESMIKMQALAKTALYRKQNEELSERVDLDFLLVGQQPSEDDEQQTCAATQGEQQQDDKEEQAEHDELYVDYCAPIPDANDATRVASRDVRAMVEMSIFKRYLSDRHQFFESLNSCFASRGPLEECGKVDVERFGYTTVNTFLIHITRTFAARKEADDAVFGEQDSWLDQELSGEEGLSVRDHRVQLELAELMEEEQGKLADELYKQLQNGDLSDEERTELQRELQKRTDLKKDKEQQKIRLQEELKQRVEADVAEYRQWREEFARPIDTFKQLHDVIGVKINWAHTRRVLFATDAEIRMDEPDNTKALAKADAKKSSEVEKPATERSQNPEVIALEVLGRQLNATLFYRLLYQYLLELVPQHAQSQQPATADEEDPMLAEVQAIIDPMSTADKEEAEAEADYLTHFLSTMAEALKHHYVVVRAEYEKGVHDLRKHIVGALDKAHKQLKHAMDAEKTNGRLVAEHDRVERKRKRFNAHFDKLQDGLREWDALVGYRGQLGHAVVGFLDKVLGMHNLGLNQWKFVNVVKLLPIKHDRGSAHHHPRVAHQYRRSENE